MKPKADYKTRLAIYKERLSKCELAISLHKQGIGYGSIEKELHISRYLIRDWVKGYCKPREPKSPEYWTTYNKNYNILHKDRINETKRASYQKYREQRCAKANQQNYELKQIVLKYYGQGKIACLKCGESDIRCLSIDHIEGNGNQHRLVIKRGGGVLFYKWLKKHDFPIGYQTLCMNCQFKKS